MERRNNAAALLLWLISICHVLYTPFTKVEESWTLHAVHDILRYGIGKSSVEKFDHIPNPGSVPRSFIGPLVLSILSYVPNRVLNSVLAPFYGQNLATQVIVRLTLATINTAAIVHLINKLCQRQDRSLILVLTACQFHVPFWMSRTVPNMLAFAPAQISIAGIYSSKSNAELYFSVWLLASTAAILRSELVTLLLPVLVGLFLQRRTQLKPLVVTGFLTILTIAISICTDSYFWQKWTWPELDAFRFNVLQGNSADWGIEPWHAYFTRHLPRLLLFGYPLALFGVFQQLRKSRNSIGLAAMASIALLSCLRHKEWRFAVYVLPLLNVVAMEAVRRLTSSKQRRRLIFAGIAGAALIFTVASTLISHYNYPGGVAASRLAQSLRFNTRPLKIHIDVLAASTGASLFTHSIESTACEYNRSEVLSPGDLATFDYLITESPQLFQFAHSTMETIRAYSGLQRRKIHIPHLPFEVAMPWVNLQPKLYILEKTKTDNTETRKLIV